jgi:hypothetical protein
MKKYKIPAGTPLIVFHQLWTGESIRRLSVRDTIFLEDDAETFESQPPDMIYFRLPKNDGKVKGIGVRRESVIIV